VEWDGRKRLGPLIHPFEYENVTVDVADIHSRARDMVSFLPLFFPTNLKGKDEFNRSMEALVDIEDRSRPILRGLLERKSPNDWPAFVRSCRALKQENETRLKAAKTNLLGTAETHHGLGARAEEYQALRTFLRGNKAHPPDFDQFLESFRDGVATFRVHADGSYDVAKVKEWKEILRYAVMYRYTKGFAPKNLQILDAEAVREHLAIIEGLTPAALYVYADVLARMNEFAYNAGGFVRLWRRRRSLKRIEDALVARNISPDILKTFRRISATLVSSAP
jgi:hypothetical protein